LRHVEYHAGVPAEDFFRDRKDAFDFIISRAVLEHLYDPISALDDMADALKPGGMLVHRIDLRDHGMFENMHPLTFLTIPEQIYRRMVRNSGRPNRVLLSAYRDWLKRSGLDGDVRITRLAGVREQLAPTPWDGISPELRHDALQTVEAIRPRIAKSLQSNSGEDLCVSGIVLRAWKSGGLRTAPQKLQNAG
jgi:SAM-dependent methyltransferase